MALSVILPHQGDTVKTCRLLEWTVQEGQTIAAGDTLCEVETDKAVIEVEAPAGGVVLKTFFEVDQQVPVGAEIALIGDSEEA